jgi:hypothetical protein
MLSMTMSQQPYAPGRLNTENTHFSVLLSVVMRVNTRCLRDGRAWLGKPSVDMALVVTGAGATTRGVSVSGFLPIVCLLSVNKANSFRMILLAHYAVPYKASLMIYRCSCIAGKGADTGKRGG